MSHTLAIIKPDAVGSGKAGKVLAHLESAGFAIRALRLTRLNRAQAGAFYAVHEGRPFYDELVEFLGKRAAEASLRTSCSRLLGSAILSSTPPTRIARPAKAVLSARSVL